MTYTIRRARAADAIRLAALAHHVWLHNYARAGISNAIANYVLQELTPQHYLTLLNDASHCVLLAERDENVLAFGVLANGGQENLAQVPYAQGYDGEIETLYVQEHFTGTGLGKALLLALQHEADQAKAGRQPHKTGQVHVAASLCLKANAQNTRALAFYQHQGFVPDGETDFVLDGVRHRNLVLGRR